MSDSALDVKAQGGETDPIGEARRIIGHATGRALVARALGGVGIALRCSRACSQTYLQRPYSDIDIIVRRKDSHELGRGLESLGYVPDKAFNAAHGRSRLLFDHPYASHVDVFIDDFVMCHRLKLASRLALEQETITLADLLLTKLQVAHLTRKDVVDVTALMLDCELSREERGINVEYVTGILRDDWGWWRTVTENLALIQARCQELGLPERERFRVVTQLQRLAATIEQTPKSMRWKARARVGDRLPWREDPEETGS